MNSFIRLLSIHPLESFTPEAFKSYITSLYFKRPPKETPKKRLREKSLKGKVLKNGKVSITTTREPKYATEEEAKKIGAELGRPANEIFLALRARDIVILTHEEAERIAREIKKIPF